MIILNNSQGRKEYEGTIRLGSGHSLIVGHGPMINLWSLENEAKQRRDDVAKFGLFEVAAPNFNTYYPDVTAEDLAPKAEDFVRPLFRALSEVVVRKNYDPIDFSKDGVLKASMNMLLAQTVYTNHEAMVGNEIGAVSKVFWAEATEKDGLKIPAGINAEFLIDGKAHPKVARGVMMDPPSIHSNSVTVNFKWAQSHPKMAFEDFRSKVGTFDAKGELIRRIATEINAYYETSLVSHGADPFAQKIGKDGKIVNPGLATRRDSFSEAIPGSTVYHFFSYKDSLSEITIPVPLNNNDDPEGVTTQNKIKMNKETILLMASIAGYTVAEGLENLSQEEFDEQFDQAAFEAHLAANRETLTAPPAEPTEELTQLRQEKEALIAEIEPLRQFKADNETLATQLADARKAQVAELSRLYAIAHGKEVPANLLETFNQTPLTALATFKESYNELAEEKYQLTCQDCKGHNIQRATANPTAGGDPGTPPTGGSGDKLSNSEIYYKIRNRKKNAQPK